MRNCSTLTNRARNFAYFQNKHQKKDGQYGIRRLQNHWEDYRTNQKITKPKKDGHTFSQLHILNSQANYKTTKNCKTLDEDGQYIIIILQHHWELQIIDESKGHYMKYMKSVIIGNRILHPTIKDQLPFY